MAPYRAGTWVWKGHCDMGGNIVPLHCTGHRPEGVSLPYDDILEGMGGISSIILAYQSRYIGVHMLGVHWASLLRIDNMQTCNNIFQKLCGNTFSLPDYDDCFPTSAKL